jgi:acetamidase/formamidase
VNMDTPEMKPGTTCYLGVNVEGALFSLGDGHYRQGEGESCGTAVEGAMTTVVIVDLIKGAAPLWPRLENDEYLMAIGSSRPMEDSWRIGNVELIRWMQELHGLHQMDAYQLLSQISKAPIANVVDVNYSVAIKAAKEFMPTASAYQGIREELKKLATLL